MSYSERKNVQGRRLKLWDCSTKTLTSQVPILQLASKKHYSYENMDCLMSTTCHLEEFHLQIPYKSYIYTYKSLTVVHTGRLPFLSVYSNASNE